MANKIRSCSFLRIKIFPALLFCLLLFGAACPAEAEPPIASGEEPPLPEMIGEMIIVGFRGLALEPDSIVGKALANRQIGGVILFSRDAERRDNRNVESPTQLRQLVAEVKALAPGRIFVAVDQEGGKVERLNANNGFLSSPSAKALGLGDQSATYASASRMGAFMSEAGINLNFAPVVDLDFPDSPAVGDLERAFHLEPDLVADHAKAFIRGMSDNGIVSTLKHFPGHGSAGTDSHLGTTDASAVWSMKELEPYSLLLAEGFDGMIMVSHITLQQYGPLPAVLNSMLIDNLLRKQLGWQGVVVSDDMFMKAVTAAYSLDEAILLAVNAGVDILVYGNNAVPYVDDIAPRVYASLLEHVESGRISPHRIRQSWRRIQELKAGMTWD